MALQRIERVNARPRRPEDAPAQTGCDVRRPERWPYDLCVAHDPPASPVMADDGPAGSLAKPSLRGVTHEVAGAGGTFDMAENPEQVLGKLHEELAEFAEARRRASHDELENEMGDLLVLVNLARFVKVDPEQALRRRQVPPALLLHLQ